MPEVDSTPLWSAERLEQLATHPDAVVRFWACQRLGDLPGNAGEPALVRLLASPLADVRQAVAPVLGPIATAASLPALREALQRERGSVAGHCAVALARLAGPAAAPELLARWQQDPGRDERFDLLFGLALTGDPAGLDVVRAVAATPDAPLAWDAARILARYGTAADMRLVVDLHRRASQPPESLAEAVDWQAAAGYYGDLLADGGAEGVSRVLRQSMDRYPHHPLLPLPPPLDLPPLRRAGDPARLMAGIAAAAHALALPADSPFAAPAARLHALVEALAATAPAGGHGRLRDSARSAALAEAGLALAALAQLLHLGAARVLWLAAAPAPGAPPADTAALLAVWSAPVPDMPSAVTEALFHCGPAIAADLASWLEADREDWCAGRSAELLGRLAAAHPRACTAALDALVLGLGAESFDNAEACTRALAAFGGEALPPLAALLATGEEEQQQAALSCLGEVSVQGCVPLVLAHWEALARGGQDLIARVCYGLAAPELIEPLRQEWRPGEPELTDSLYLLAHLHGVQFPELPQVEADLAAMEERADQVSQPDAAETNPGQRHDSGPRLALACKQCGRTYHYDVGIIHMAASPADADEPGRPSEENIAFQQEVRCKRCGAIDAYRLTGAAYAVIRAEMMRMLSWLEPGPGRVRLHPPAALLDGRRLPLQEILADYRSRIAAQPDDPVLHLRLGNVFRTLERYPAAVAEYRAALALDPDQVEAEYNLAAMAEDQGEPEEAQEHFRRCLALVAARSEVSDTLRKIAAAAAEYLGVDSPLPPAAPVQVGRNDPCPCGSGRKYKKCCGAGR